MAARALGINVTFGDQSALVAHAREPISEVSRPTRLKIGSQNRNRRSQNQTIQTRVNHHDRDSGR